MSCKKCIHWVSPWIHRRFACLRIDRRRIGFPSAPVIFRTEVHLKSGICTGAIELRPQTFSPPHVKLCFPSADTNLGHLRSIKPERQGNFMRGKEFSLVSYFLRSRHLSLLHKNANYKLDGAQNVRKFLFRK
jgi:hypothetical protein